MVAREYLRVCKGSVSVDDLLTVLLELVAFDPPNKGTRL